MSVGHQRIGGYNLISLIRAGRTCEIWEVRKDDSDERRALKLLPMGPRHAELVPGLKNEFLAGKGLKHDGVIGAQEYGTDKDGSYLVMELFRAPNLKQMMNIGVDQLAYFVDDIIRQAASGLSYVHEAGWIHRDAKPDNFLLNEDIDIKLIDFSLAERRKTGLAKKFARKSKVQGTLSYMAPEQIRGRVADERTDVYGFGCTLHELVSGKLPFTGVNATDLLNKHLKVKPPILTALNRNVTSDFAKLVMSMLSKDPDRRPASIQQFLDIYQTITIFRRQPSPPQQDE